MPAAGTDLETLRTDGRSEPHFRLWFLRADTTGAPGKAISKTSAREMIAEAVAAEISRLLIQGRHNRACFGERPLEEGDIAVLVRTNSEARLMQRALSALHVSSVLHSTGNLFDSYEALEMERLMWGIIDPNNESLLKGALATDMIGLYAEQLDVLAADEIGLEEWLVRFQSYNDMWGGRGFIRMFRCFLSEQDVLARLMSLPDGERRCTNIVHLSEVLHQRSVEKKLGMADLLKWLSEQREEDAYRNEEHPQRLESDENAVRLVTIHKSKGLEYPIVFCPFAWAGSRIKESKGPITFHDEDDDMRLTLDLGSPEIQRNLVLAERELLSENLRLLYVALTRAKSRCYLIWGHFKDGETSALSYLFHQPDSWEPKDVVNATKERCSSLSDEDMLRELRTVSEMAMGTIGLSEMPVGPGQEYLHPAGKKETLTCREFGGSIDSQWRVSSFSSLISGFPHGYEMPDRDALGIPEGYDETALEEAEAREPASNFFSFPKGARAGTFVHDIFEHMDFTEKDPAVLKGLVARKLDEYDFEHHWLNSVCDMVRNVLSAHLDTSSTDLSLSCIRSEDRLNELEFYFPLKMVSPEKIEGLLKGLVPTHRAESTDSIHRLYFAPTKGFMKGFMDMVFNWRDRFYLVDWKSNHLGNKVGDYDRASLAVVMKKNLYLLQYSLYTLALDQYLKLRMPDYRYEKHFGGVFYIFVRGVDPETGPDFGIYRDLPSSELIKALRNNLLPDKAW